MAAQQSSHQSLMDQRLRNFNASHHKRPATIPKYMALSHPTAIRTDVYEVYGDRPAVNPQYDRLYLAYEGSRFQLCMFVRQIEEGCILVKRTICTVEYAQQPDTFFFAHELFDVHLIDDVFHEYHEIMGALLRCKEHLVVCEEQIDPFCAECSLFGLHYQLRPLRGVVHVRVCDLYEGWTHEAEPLPLELFAFGGGFSPHVLIDCHPKLQDVKHYLASLRGTTRFYEYDEGGELLLEATQFDEPRCNKTWIFEFDTGRLFIGELRPKRKRTVQVQTLQELKSLLFSHYIGRLEADAHNGQ